MLRRMAAIALNTYRESVRARILVGLAGVAFAVGFYSLVVGAYTLSEAPRVVSDLGGAVLSIFAIAVAVLVGVTSLHRELEQKTILPLLARPVGRAEYLVGKYLGMMVVLGCFVVADTGLVLMLCAATGDASPALVAGVGLGLAVAFGLAAWRSAWVRTFGPLPLALVLLAAGIVLSSAAPVERRVVLSSAALAACEMSIVAALTLFFASFSTPFLSALLTLLLFLIGRNADALARLPKKLFGPELSEAGKVLAKLVPNLHVYVPARPLLTGEAVDANLASYLAMALVASVGWTVLLLALASLVFRRRDFL
ncbi:MAG: ABC transporter permease subunit [Myxococcales bacterium]|nr:ABC transporter permease subunit [Myxococcales bacterium]